MRNYFLFLFFWIFNSLFTFPSVATGFFPAKDAREIAIEFSKLLKSNSKGPDELWIKFISKHEKITKHEAIKLYPIVLSWFEQDESNNGVVNHSKLVETKLKQMGAVFGG